MNSSPFLGHCGFVVDFSVGEPVRHILTAEEIERFNHVLPSKDIYPPDSALLVDDDVFTAPVGNTKEALVLA